MTLASEFRNFTAGHCNGDIAEGVTGHGTAPIWIGSRQHRMLRDGSGLYRVSIPAIGTGQPFGCPAQPTIGTGVKNAPVIAVALVRPLHGDAKPRLQFFAEVGLSYPMLAQSQAFLRAFVKMLCELYTLERGESKYF